MSKPSEFTPEEIAILKENPYTFRITKYRLSLTAEAKEKIVELSSAGSTYRQIVEELGYDPQMLGLGRAKDMVRDILRDVKEGKAIHEGYLRTVEKRMSTAALEKLDCDPASYRKLKNEVIYLRKEVEFLKKISQQVLSGKQGK